MMRPGKATVLVVDDKADLRDVVAIVLESAGYTVQIAANGQEALDRYANSTPALIILDLMMPVLDGIGLVREIRRRGIWAGVPILVISVHDLLDEQLAEVGLTEYLPKPFGVQELLGKVRALVHSSVSAHATGSEPKS